MHLYMKLSNAEGLYIIEVMFVHLGTGQVLRKGRISFEATNRLGTSDFIISPPPIVFPSEGRYEFQIWANGNYIGGSLLDITKRLRGSKSHGSGHRKSGD